MARRKNGLYRFEITREHINKVMRVPGGFRQDIKDWLNECVGQQVPVDRKGSPMTPDVKGWALFSEPTRKGYVHYVVFTHVGDMVHFRLVWI